MSSSANAIHFQGRNWPITCDTGTVRIAQPNTRRLPITTIDPNNAMVTMSMISRTG